MSGCGRIVSGEMHYPRVPRAYWRARLDMAYAMGLNAISTYVFWNLHEPREQTYDFSGNNDVAHYVREAAAAGLDVLLRPGPYVCAEWDFGGLPAWLLAGPDAGIRTAGQRYMRSVRGWLKRLGEELAPLQRSRGGPIVAVQLENEYGAFGDDPDYLRALRAALDDAGFGESPYYTIDQPRDLAKGCLPDVPAAATFGPGDPAREFEALRALRPQAPLLAGEYWAGWFDHWGEPHQLCDDRRQADDLDWMLRNGSSVNVYMFHGGTNFGFHNGANATGERAYQPTTTSYDYLAALDEAGRPTAKYHAFREIIAARTGIAPRAVPVSPQTSAIPPFALTDRASPYDLLGEALRADGPVTMESLGQSFGYVLYRTILPGTGSGVLEVDELRDYATILLDGKPAGSLDRRLGESSLELATATQASVLDLLVENCGRINYGPELPHQRKGITRAVTWGGRELHGWQMFGLPLDDLAGLHFSPEAHAGAPAFFRGRFELSEPRDTFLDTRGLGKGVLFVNGHNAGRFWSVGPQFSLYVPAVWLRQGTNEIIAFDVKPQGELFIRGCAEPILGI